VADHTRQAASGTWKHYRQSEMEGAQTTYNVASDSRKDATTRSSPTGNGSSEHNLDSTLRKSRLCHWAPCLRSTNAITNAEY